jgi:four helix bundle protein
MDDTTFLPHQRTDIYQVAMQLCVSVRDAKIRDAELRDQAQRASVSTFLAVSEGLPHASPRMRKQYFERARASAWEVASAIHLAKELGAMDEPRWRTCHSLATRASAMLVALARKCG